MGMAMELSVNLFGNKLKFKPDGPFSACPRLTQDLPTRRLFPDRRSRAKRKTKTKRILLSLVSHVTVLVLLSAS